MVEERYGQLAGRRASFGSSNEEAFVPCSFRPQNQSVLLTVVPSLADEPRQRGPLGEQLTDAELEPIRVHMEHGGWQVDYGSYAQGYHDSREEAIAEAITAAAYENRELAIERPRPLSETAQHGDSTPLHVVESFAPYTEPPS
jgi:hypothetical protein